MKLANSPAVCLLGLKSPIQLFTNAIMSKIKIIAEQFALHSKLFNNVLRDVEDIQGNSRVSEQVNHLQWIAGHLANARYNYTTMIGLNKTFPFRELYVDPTKPPPGNREIDISLSYPSLTEITTLWNDLAEDFVAGISALSDEQAATALPFGTPIGDNSMLGFFGFLSSHEVYHIGQMSLIRKYLGLPAMSYQ
jgi:hypothetical protein